MMDQTYNQWNIPEGVDVIAADGDKLGKVVTSQPDYIVVEKGFFFPTEYYIPTSAIASFDGERAQLNVTKDVALNQGWDSAPAARTWTETQPSEAADRWVEPTDPAVMDPRFATETPSTTELNEQGETLRVPVHEEELTATTHEVDRGEVRVRKDVVTEERQMDVPVTEERVHVERRRVDRDVRAGEDAFQEETYEVPIRGEEVDVQTRTRVAEEIDIEKQPVKKTKRVSGQVRREEVHLDESDAGLSEESGAM